MIKGFRILGLTLAAVTAAIASSAAGQDGNADPHYGTITLEAGFEPDPRVINLSAGGGINADSIRNGCNGFITDAPDVRLRYDAGSLPLILSVAANSDTTLVVNGPDGRFYCDDDGGNGSNPSIRFNNPMSGRYEIWVGTYRSGDRQPARLHISEASSQ